MPRNNSARIATKLTQLGAAIEANAADFAHMEAERLELRTVVPQIVDLAAAQAAHYARSQQTTKDLNELTDRGRVLFAQLRAAVKAKYNTRSEKLTEFGLRPLSRRRQSGEKTIRKGKQETPTPAATTTT